MIEGKGVCMESVSFKGGNYNNTVYNGEQKTANNNVNVSKKHSKDSFDKKYKQKNSKVPGAVGTILLMGISAFAAYKNKSKISQFSSQLKEKSGDALSSLRNKFPNLSDAASSLGKACDKPWSGIKNAAGKASSTASDIINGIKDKAANFHFKKV